MKKIISLSLTLCFITCSFAQNFNKPDYDMIKSSISKKDADTYYPKLFKRYTDNDTTLTLDEFRLLYYGFLFQPDYAVYETSDYKDSLKELDKKESLSSSEYDDMIRYEKAILKKSPFDIRDLSTLEYAYDKKGDSASGEQASYKLQHIAIAILSTGDGKTKETGFHVISINHEYDMLMLLGLKFGGTQSLIVPCDYLTVQKNDFNLEGVYFDVTKVLEAEENLFKH